MQIIKTNVFADASEAPNRFSDRVTMRLQHQLDSSQCEEACTYTPAAPITISTELNAGLACFPSQQG